MPIVATQIELQTQQPGTALVFSNIEKYKDGTGYHCNLIVQSGRFSCEGRFYFDERHLADAIEQLQSMERGSPGEAIIKDESEQDYVQFEMNRLRHVFVTGELREISERPQLFKFGFGTDQTVLGPLIRDLEALRR